MIIRDVYSTKALYDSLVGRGFEPPQEAKRLYEAITREAPAVLREKVEARLREAIVKGDEKAVAQARFELTEISAVQTAWSSEVDLREDHARELRRIIANPAFAFMRGLWHESGARFTGYLSTVDVNASAETVIVEGSEAQRVAWAGTPALARELDALASLFASVVNMLHSSKYSPGRSEYALGLLVRINGAHIRRLAECWELPPDRLSADRRSFSAIDRACAGRGGKWGGLVSFGAEIGCPVSTFAEYRPLEIADKVVRNGVVLDPYDSEEAWKLHEQRKRARQQRETEQRAKIKAVGGVI